MDGIYKLSMLRVFVEDDTLTVDENITDEVCHVKYKYDKYFITSNRKYYEQCISNNMLKINVKIDNDLDDVVTELVTSVSQQILNPMQVALMYDEIFEFTGISQQLLATRVGKTQGAISNKLRLLKLPLFVQREIINGRLKERHGRAILTLANKDNYEQHALELTKQCLEQKWRVVDLEAAVNKLLGKPQVKPKRETQTNLIPVTDKSVLKNREAILSLNQLNSDLEQSFKLLKQILPNVVIEKQDGICGDDYVINVVLKDINKET